MNLDGMTKEELLKLKEELEFKVNLYNTKQLTTKIIINSVYGAMSKESFNMFNIDNACAITSSGRFFIRNMANRIEEKLQELLPWDGKYIVYGDTDSVYLTIEPFIKRKYGSSDIKATNDVIDFCDNFEKQIIAKIIQESIEEYARTLNVFDERAIGVAREVISESVVFVAKKRYFMKVSDLEGVRFPEDDPYIKVMGLDIVRSSTPIYIKKKLKEAVKIILESTEDNLLSWLKEVEKDFAKQKLSDISMFGSVSKIREDFDTSKDRIHINAKASGACNRYIKENKLENSIELLKEGEKYKKCYLKLPNSFKSDSLMFDDPMIERIIEKENIFDYKKNFEVTFRKPLQGMIESLGYNLNVKTLDIW